MEQKMGGEDLAVCGGGNPFLGGSGEIFQKLAQLKLQTKETGEILKRLVQVKGVFTCKCQDRQSLEGMIINFRRKYPQPTAETREVADTFEAQKQDLENQLKQGITVLIKSSNNFKEKIGATVFELRILQSQILDMELMQWKQEQRSMGSRNGPADENISLIKLNELQTQCEGLAELIWFNRQQLKEANDINSVINQYSQSQAASSRNLELLQETVNQLLYNLVESTFIVEKQPPQVFKTTTVTSPSVVRLLVGGQLSLHMNPPQVTVSIISEERANALLHPQNIQNNPIKTSGEIVNNTGTMEYDQTTRQLSVQFRNLRINKILRADKRSKTDAVTDEKFCFHYQCQFTAGERELDFNIYTLSLPVVVIVHNIQETKAWATIMWDNAFSALGRNPFEVPEQVSWSRMARALSDTFKSHTGGELTESNLQFLGEKAFSNPFVSPLNPLTWVKFCKENLPGREFTFWEYFYHSMRLTQKHFRGEWMDRLVIGFVGRQQAEEMLSACREGTFLLRFSDSKLGGITITWVQSNNQILSVDPFTSNELTIRPLSNQIKDLNQVRYLYPGSVEKDTAFKKYYNIPSETSTSSTTGAYVMREQTTTYPGLPETPAFQSNTFSNIDVSQAAPPLSPLCYFPQSPTSPSCYQNYQSSLPPFDQAFNSYFAEIPEGNGMDVDVCNTFNIPDLLSQFVADHNLNEY